MKHDLSFCYAGSLGESLNAGGITPSELRKFVRSRRSLFASLQKEIEQGEIEFIHHIRRDGEGKEWERLSRRLRTDSLGMIVIGIGGSSLGARSLYEALAPFRDGKLKKLYFFDNVDPEKTFLLLRQLDLKEMIINVVTKSGETLETLAHFLLILETLGKRQDSFLSSRVIITTASRNGDLAAFAGKKKIPVIFLGEKEVGRFSVLGPAGLFPLRYAGFDTSKLLSGAGRMLERCRNFKDPHRNPALVYASLKRMLETRGKREEVVFAYSSLLEPLLDWYSQLLAESSGKKFDLRGRVVHEGQTPIPAVGALDQHSLLQLFLEGKKDKVVSFWEVERFRKESTISPGSSFRKGFSFLQNKTFGMILRAEKLGTEHSLLEADVPCFTLRIPVIDEDALGQLITLLEMQVFFFCRMAGVDPFNQPGVELGKRITREILSGKESPEVSSRRKRMKVLCKRYTV